MVNRKRIIVLTGAGISAESGLATFRDNGGLWEQYRFEDVASIDAWYRDPALVQRFYNMRRKDAAAAQPNAAHRALAQLEAHHDVQIITQNVDDLHERGGSTNILHLHGELRKVRSTGNPRLIYDVGDREIHMGDLAEDGCQLRPHIVWFGEDVPLIHQAAQLCATADVFVVIGTSLQVYPAAGLLDYVEDHVPKYVVGPETPPTSLGYRNIKAIVAKATEGVPLLVQELAGQQ